MLIDFKDDDFDSKIKNDNVSIILFSAIWCSPCKVYKPILQKVSDEYKDKEFTGKRICYKRKINIVYNKRDHSFSTTDLRKRTENQPIEFKPRIAELEIEKDGKN